MVMQVVALHQPAQHLAQANQPFKPEPLSPKEQKFKWQELNKCKALKCRTLSAVYACSSLVLFVQEEVGLVEPF